jgi:hypothetical protein
MKLKRIVSKKIFIVFFIFSTKNNYSLAQNIAINNTGATANPSAALDISAFDKGLLIPRVALTSTLIYAPVTGAPTTSLLVYNTQTAGTYPTDVTPGYYFWDGTRWQRFLSTQNQLFQSINFQSLQATNVVDIVSNGISSTAPIGLSLTLTVPPYSNVTAVLNYSVPMGIINGVDTNGYYGIQVLKNGSEFQGGSRKTTFIKRTAGCYSMTTISSQFMDNITNNTGTALTITYSLNGYIEEYDANNITVRFNMWDMNPSSPNYNWGRATFSLQSFVQ